MRQIKHKDLNTIEFNIVILCVFIHTKCCKELEENLTEATKWLLSTEKLFPMSNVAKDIHVICTRCREELYGVSRDRAIESNLLN